MKVEKGYYRNPMRLEGFAAEIFGFQPTSGFSPLIIALRFEIIT